jgi:hypothetical protein
MVRDDRIHAHLLEVILAAVPDIRGNAIHDPKEKKEGKTPGICLIRVHLRSSAAELPSL